MVMAREERITFGRPAFLAIISYRALARISPSELHLGELRAAKRKGAKLLRTDSDACPRGVWQ